MVFFGWDWNYRPEWWLRIAALFAVTILLRALAGVAYRAALDDLRLR